jgi:zinc and cadmium transporter
MHVWLWTFGSIALVSVTSLAGAFALSLDEGRVRRLSLVLVSFAAGALLGDAFLHLIPEALERRGAGNTPGLLVLAGILLFFMVEKLLRHHHGPLYRQHHPEHAEHSELIAINLIGDSIHNLIDGMLIAGGYLVSPALGISTSAAVLLHELPQELGDFGVLVHAGLSPKKALLWNAATALVSLAGAAITLLAGARMGPALTDTLIPITAGGFVYIALADLVPELQHDRTLSGLAIQASLIAAGIAVMAALKEFGG